MNFFIETYGCQMNVSDSELIVSILMQAGYKHVEAIKNADIILFNTCSVRQHAEDRVMGRISNEMKRKKSNKNLLIGVVGCMAQRLGNELHKMNSSIDFVIGVDQYKYLPEIIDNCYKNKQFHKNIRVNHSEIYQEMTPTHQGKNNAFITIMRGCNNFCTYCIVPYTRGRERSRPDSEIISEVNRVGKLGFKDITLLGQNVNSYNFEKVSFPILLKKVASIDSIKRVRFVTSHPKDLSDELIEVMASNPKVCNHIHLPMQSGSTEILKRMNRGYSAEHYQKLIDKLKSAIPTISISTDIIAGFPGETDEQFEMTYRMMENIRFDYAFTFKYSPRSGTKAAEYSDQIPEEVRLKRLQKLITLQEKITYEAYQKQIGKIKEIYVEKISRRDKSEVAGRSKDYKITVFPGDKDLIGKFVDVKITSAVGWTLKGEMIK